MRLLAALMLVAASGAFGYSLVLAEKRRERLVNGMITRLEILRSEISARLSPLPDCFRLLSETGPEACRSFYSSLLDTMDALGEMEFARLWDACLSVQELPAEAASALSELGKSLGRYSAQEQRSAIERCIERLKFCSAERHEKSQQTARLRLGLPLCAGVLLAVILY